MAQKGYRPVSLPPCKSRVKSQVPPRPTTTLPPLGSQSCFVKFEDGSFQIISPGVSGGQLAGSGAAAPTIDGQ